MQVKKQGRVLGYQLAKEITQEKMIEVSGGFKFQTQGTCLRPSGIGMGDWDTIVDVHVDW